VENGDFRESAAQGAAPNPDNDSSNADLIRLIQLWPTLCEDTQRAILDLVRR